MGIIFVTLLPTRATAAAIVATEFYEEKKVPLGSWWPYCAIIFT